MVGGALLPFQVTCGGGSSGLIETLFYTLQPEVQLLAAQKPKCCNNNFHNCEKYILMIDVQNRFWFNLWNKYTRDEMFIFPL